MRIRTLDELKTRAAAVGPKIISVANPGEDDIFKALALAYREGIIHGFLVGDSGKISGFAQKHGLKPEHFTIVSASDEMDAARKAVSLVREKTADFLMKGTLSTSTFLKSVLDREIGLRKPDHLLSHVAIQEVPGFSRLLILTDAAFNIAPDVEEKAKIIDNAVKVAHIIGLERPRVACVAAIEKVNPKIESTLHADALKKMGESGRFPRAIVEGPFGFDNAVDEHCAAIKGLSGEVAGKADIILAPDMDSGNMIYKTLTTLAGSVAAAVVVGTTAPVILTSRADNDHTKLVSLALGALDAHHNY